MLYGTMVTTVLWVLFFFPVRGGALEGLTCPALLRRLTPQAIFMATNTVTTGIRWNAGWSINIIPPSAWHVASSILLVFPDPGRAY